MICGEHFYRNGIVEKSLLSARKNVFLFLHYLKIYCYSSISETSQGIITHTARHSAVKQRSSAA